ncbi:uncharacterized protein LOC134220712 isoform X2 [Armigeres subalbatus]
MITTTKVIKRIGFKPKKSVKEFFASEETATIWCNSYELSADNTPPGLVIADASTVKDDSKAHCAQASTENYTRQGNKENRLSLEERRASFGDNSSIWNLSISASEEERRRLKAENSINSSVLNTTERLTQDPLPLSRSVLRQKQLEVCEDTSAMDISPVKQEGKLSSPRKILYHHPKQNMFVTIDVPNEKPSAQSPNDSDIIFFGPQKNQTTSKDTEQPRVLFQTSNTNNQWRNKSIQTEPRPSMAEGMRSTAVNADLSAGWSSHIAASEPFGQRLTFGNSQAEISEGWNSHPAAALRLKMLQQGMVSMEFDPRISDGGGGEDIDTTLAITQTVTKMLERGSRTTSLDSTRVVEADPMDVTGSKKTHTDDQMDTSVHMEEPVEDETITDVRLPTNALSRARPSFVPSAVPMDDSQSPEEEIVAVSGCHRKPKQRYTLLETIPVETTQTERDASFLTIGTSHEPSPENLIATTHGRTIIQEEKIIEDSVCLAVPQVEIQTPPKTNMRQTVYNTKMDRSPAEQLPAKCSETPMFIVEPIKLDLPELIFGEHSIGLGLSTKDEPTPHDTNRPKIHRMPPRNLKLEFGAVMPEEGSQKNAERKDPASTIIIDSPDLKSHQLLNRKTVHALGDISLDKELLRKSADSDEMPRRTNFQNLDVSVVCSPIGEDLAAKRVTVYSNENLNESECQQPKEDSKPRRTIKHNEEVECESPESGTVPQPNSSRRTKFLLGDMDQSMEQLASDSKKSRKTNALEHDVSVEIVEDHERDAIITNKDPRPRTTIFYDDRLEQTRLDLRSELLENLRSSDHVRKTIQTNEAMECESPEPKNCALISSSPKNRFSSRDMEQSIALQCPSTDEASDKESKSANVDNKLDVSVEIVENDRGAVLAEEIHRKPPRATIMYNEQLEQTCLESHSESLNNLRRLDHARKTIQQNEAMECVSPEKSRAAQSNSSRKTKFLSSDMDQSKVPMLNHYADSDGRKMPDIVSNDIPGKARNTILCNEQLELTRLESRSGSLEDLRTSGQARKTIKQSEPMEWVSPEPSSVTQPSDPRRTKFLLDDMDHTQSCPPVLESMPRSKTSTLQIMEDTVNKSPITKTDGQVAFVTSGNDFHDLDVAMDSPVNRIQEANKNQSNCLPREAPKHSRATMLCNEQLEETRLVPRSGSLEDLRNRQSRKTIERIEFVSPGAGSSIQSEEVLKIRNRLKDVANSPISRSANCSKSRLTTVQDVDQTIDRSPHIDAPLESVKHRESIHMKTDMDQSICSRKSVLLEVPKQKSRHTIIARESMDQTLIDRQVEVSQAPQRKSPTNTQHKSRQTIIGRESMDETLVDRHLEVSQGRVPQRISQRRTSGSDKKSRQTIIGRQNMDETLLGKHVETQQNLNMRESLADSHQRLISHHSGLPDIVSHKSRLTSYHETAMEETRVFQDNCGDVSQRLEQCSPALRTDLAVSKIGQDRVTSNLHETDKNENYTNRMIHIDETIRQSPDKTDDVPTRQTEKSRFTSYATDRMDETLSPASKLESIVLERSRMCADVAEPSMQKSRQTVHQEAPMDETGYTTPPHNLTLPPRGSIIQSLSNVSRPIVNDEHFLNESNRIEETSKRTSIPVQKMSSIRQTLYQMDPMEETTVALRNISVANLGRISRLSPFGKTTDTTNLRQTLHKQQDMDRTTAGNRETLVENGVVSPMQEGHRTFHCKRDSEPTVEMTDEMHFDAREVNESVCNESTVPISCSSPAQKVKNGIVPTATVISQNDYKSNKPNRQTILVAEDMDQSLIMHTSTAEVSSNKFQPSRRTIIQPDKIVEESFNYPVIKEELSDSTPNASPTLVIQEQTKQDFSFAIPQLPDDCVLRSTAPIPYYKSNPAMQNAPQLPQPVFANCSITEPNSSTRKTIAVDNLSEISGLELSNCHPIRPVGGVFGPPGEIGNLTLKEVTEPTITPLAPVAVSVIQETPKKASLIPVRKSRGSIFDRQSLDLDESGIAQIVSQEPLEPNELLAPQTTKINVSCFPVQTEDEIVIKNEPIVESSDDEFYDAQLDPENGQPSHQDYVHVTKEAVQRNIPSRGNLKFIEIDDAEHCQSMLANQTNAGYRTVKFIDVDDLEQTTQKRHLSQISKSVLLDHENDPLNVSLTDDYPMKKRKTKIPTPLKRSRRTSLASAEPDQKSLRRVTFHENLVLSVDSDEKDKCSDGDVNNLPEVETVTIKKECATIKEEDADCTKLGQTILTDPSVFIIEESDMLANESNISFVGSPPSEHHHRGSTLKFDNTYYQDYVNLTLHVDQTANNSCIVISDDSLTAASHMDAPKPNVQSLETRLTMEDLPERIHRTRESLVLNSTVASEVMYELRQQISEAKKVCCSFQGNCECRSRRTKVAVEQENLETIREAWNQNFDRILNSVSDLPSHNIPLDDRISEVFSRPMKPLPLAYLEQLQQHFPETPPVRFLCENYLSSEVDNVSLSAEQSTCDLPATPCVTALLFNKLQTERFRWFLDISDENQMFLHLRHRMLRSIRFNIQLQKRQYSKQEDIRIIRLEFTETPSDLVDSPRLLIAHLEFVRALNKSIVDHLCSQYPTTAHFMGLIVHLDTIVEQIFGKVDQLYRIVRNNGAILKSVGHERQLQIDKFYEYQHEDSIHWNRLYVRFDAIDRINHHSVIFHRKMINAECLLPTEQQCGKNADHGLTFLECLLWNVEKISIV